MERDTLTVPNVTQEPEMSYFGHIMVLRDFDIQQNSLTPP